MIMKERVGVAELKARLSAYLRRVRKGHPITVFDRDTPVARLVPLDSEEVLAVRQRTGRVERLSEVRLPPALRVDVDILDLLAEERQPGR